MLLLPTLRSLGRVFTGRRPKPQDLERMIADLRRRLSQGETVRPFTPRLPPEWTLRRVRALQLAKLRRTVAYVQAHVPYYRRVLDAAGLRARDIRTFDDLRRLPITRRADLQAERNEFLSRAPGMEPALVLSTSGTTGRPLEMYLTPGEFDYYVAVQALSGMNLGFLGPAHVLQVHLSQDFSFAARVFSAAAVKAGAMVLNAGVTGDLDASLESLTRLRDLPGKHPRVSGLFAAPGQLWALTARAEALGLSPSSFGLRRVFTCGAKVSSALRERVQRVFGLPLREAYSMVETPGTGVFECEQGRLHFLDLSGIIEFLDPDTQAPVPPGQPGVAVVTTFHPERELMPLLRYWSHDALVPAAETACPCGMVSTQVDEIRGRMDDMLILGARNLYPQSQGDALTAFPELVQPPRFRMRMEERARAQCVVLEVECLGQPEESARAGLARRIHQALPVTKDPYIASGTFECEVRPVPRGSLSQVFPYKLQGAVLYPSGDTEPGSEPRSRTLGRPQGDSSSPVVLNRAP